MELWGLISPVGEGQISFVLGEGESDSPMQRMPTFY